jgi:hypothetical protein
MLPAVAAVAPLPCAPPVPVEPPVVMTPVLPALDEPALSSALEQDNGSLAENKTNARAASGREEEDIMTFSLSERRLSSGRPRRLSVGARPLRVIVSRSSQRLLPRC